MIFYEEEFDLDAFIGEGQDLVIVGAVHPDDAVLGPRVSSWMRASLTPRSLATRSTV